MGVSDILHDSNMVLCKPVTIQCVSFCEELCGECEGLQHRRMFIPIVLCTYVVILYSTVL